jgi:EmrB/QacA subfamily drug resistance transporter
MTEQLHGRRLVLATAGVMLALLLASLDQTIVGTAMPRIIADLNGLDYYAWVTTAYLVTSTVVVPIAGKLGDMFGRKPFLLTGMIGFVLSSALCGLAQNMGELVAFRGIQGLFGGFLFASVFTVIGDLFPPERRGRIQGVFGGVFALSSIVGPTIGGYLTDTWTWRWVFYVNVPVGIAAVAVVALFLPYVRSKALWRDIDFLGAFLLSAGLVPVLIGLSITKDHSWTDPLVLGLLGGGILMLILFFIQEQRDEHPIVPFHLFKNNVFAVSMVVGFISAFGMFGSIIFVPLIFQGVLGVSVTNSGLLLTPMMMGLIVTSTIVGFVMVRIKYYRFLGTLGVAVMMLGMYLLAQITPDDVQWTVTRNIVLIGIGLGMTFPLYITAVQSAIPREFLGVATSQVQFWRNVGGTVSTAVMGSILARLMPTRIQDQVSHLTIPPALKAKLASGLGRGGGSAQSLFDAKKLAQLKAALGPQLYDQFLRAIKLGLASTLHDIFLIAGGIMVIALIATVFMKEVPLRRESPVQRIEDEAAGQSPVAAVEAG